MNQIAQAVAAEAVEPARSEPARVDSAAALAKDATVKDLMTPPVGLFRGTETVADAVETLREATKSAFIT